MIKLDTHGYCSTNGSDVLEFADKDSFLRWLIQDITDIMRNNFNSKESDYIDQIVMWSKIIIKIADCLDLVSLDNYLTARGFKLIIL